MDSSGDIWKIIYFGIWEITAQCDARYPELYKYSYLLTYTPAAWYGGVLAKRRRAPRPKDLPCMWWRRGRISDAPLRNCCIVKKVKKRIAVCATSTAPLRELTCHMGSHSVTCHPAEVTFPPLPKRIKASTRFSDPRGMHGWVDLVGLCD